MATAASPTARSTSSLTREHLHTLTDSELTQEFMLGCEEAFNEIVRRYKKRIFLFCVHYVHDDHEAEDLTQEIFFRLYQMMHRYDPSRSFEIWFLWMARNKCLNYLRDHKKDRRLVLQIPEAEDMGFASKSSDADSQLLKRELRKIIYFGVSQISKRHREVFVLREFEERSYEEICQLTGEKLGTIKSRLSRAREAFARSVRPLLD